MRSKTRVISTLLLLVLFVLLLTACDSGLKYVKMEIETLPEKTVYYVGKDTALQFDDGKVKLTTLDGSTSMEDLCSYSYRQAGTSGGEDRSISSNVNFDLPGEYTVTVHQTKELSCKYVIEVRTR